MGSQKQTSRAKRSMLAPHVCEIPGCGYGKIIQRHRIIPGREGGRYVLGNVIALCPTHHCEADLGWWDREVLCKLVEERIERWKIEKDSEFLIRLEQAEAARKYVTEASSKANGNASKHRSNGANSRVVGV